MFKRKKKKTGCETLEFRSKVPMPPVKPPKPPKSGSNAFKPSPVAVLPNNIGTVVIMCQYETPCGYCTKWDKKCDKKIGCEKQKQSYDFSADVNKACISESDHEWECCGISSIGWDYICKKCYTHKHIPYETTTLETHFTNSIKGEQQ